MTMGWHMVMGFEALAYRVLHLERKPQLRHDPEEQGVRDQYPDRRSGGEGRRHRQYVRP